MSSLSSSHPYTVGAELDLILKDGPSMKAEIVGIKTFTMSCVTVVQLDHPTRSGRFILKLYDRRFATQLREDEGAEEWSPQIDSAYHEYVSGGHASKVFDEWTSAALEDPRWYLRTDDEWDDKKAETYLQYLCQKGYATETNAYNPMSDMQGTHVPRLVGEVLLQPSTSSDLPSRFMDCPGILLQYIEGFPLTDLADHLPREDRQRICEEAVNVVLQIGEKGICNLNVNTRSFIVTTLSGTTSLRPVMMDFGLCVFRSQAKDEQEFESWLMKMSRAQLELSCRGGRATASPITSPTGSSIALGDSTTNDKALYCYDCSYQR